MRLFISKTLFPHSGNFVERIARVCVRGETIGVAAFLLMLEGCVSHGPYVPPAIDAEGIRLKRPEDTAFAVADEGVRWWKVLEDPAVDHLVEEALRANPSLRRAVAVVDQARAEARISKTSRLPSVGFDASTAHQNVAPKPETGARNTTVSNGSLSVAWEIDLFGRVRNGVAVSRYRLDSRIAEAEAVRLSLAADVADTLMALRACRHSVGTLEADIASRQNVLALTMRRREAGLDAEVDVALSETGLAAAQTALALRHQECAGLTNALVLLTGLPSHDITATLLSSPNQPQTSPLPDALPARLLLKNPGVVAAERNVAAAWADIGVARAERIPRLDLTAALTGQWMRALGATADSSLGSLGAGLMFPLFDGGRGKAAVTASEARYEAAVADLDATLRASVRDVENALAAAASTRSRKESAGRTVTAATATLHAREAQWRAGGVSQFEVEDARRQLGSANDSLIEASRDAAQAWIALFRAAGPDILIQESPAQ